MDDTRHTEIMEEALQIEEENHQDLHFKEQKFSSINYKIEDEEHQQAIDYKELADKYKQKLIILARAYAKLLNTIESYEVALQQHINPNKKFKNDVTLSSTATTNNNNPDESKEDDQLLYCNEESSAMDIKSSSLARWESTKSELSLNSVSNNIVSFTENNSTNPSIERFTSLNSQNGTNININPTTSNLERYESVLSQKSTFSTFISQCGTDLGPLPEIDSLLSFNATIHNNMSLTIPSILPPLSTYQSKKANDDLSVETNVITNNIVSIPTVRVGVGVLIKDPKNGNNVFVGIRQGSHGEGTLAFPGGYLEMEESWEQCAKREVMEETGLSIHNLKHIHTTNDIYSNEKRHHITIFMSGTCCDVDSRPQTLEPHKCQGWNSYSWEEMKLIASGKKQGYVLFPPLLKLVQSLGIEEFQSI